MRVKAQILWLGSSAILSKTLNLVSSGVLMYYFSPTQFGLVAIPLSFYYMLIGLFNFSFESALIQFRKEADKKMLMTAFTLEFLKSISLAILVYTSATFIARYLNNESIVGLIKLVSLVFFIDGFKNIMVYSLKRDLDFKKLALIEMISNIIGVIITLFFVIYISNQPYFIVLGLIMNRLTYVILSYVFVNGFFRFGVFRDSIIKLFSFSKWLMISSVFSIARSQVLNIIIPRLSDFNSLGIYNRSYTFSEEIFIQVNNLQWKFGFPYFSKLQNNDDSIYSKFVAFRLYTIGVTFFSTVVYSLSYQSFINRFLTKEWENIGVFLIPMLLNSSMLLIQAPFGMVYQSIGRPKFNTYLNITGGVVFFVLLYPLYLYYGLLGLLYASFSSMLLTYFISEIIMFHVLKLMNWHLFILTMLGLTAVVVDRFWWKIGFILLLSSYFIYVKKNKNNSY